MRRSEAVSPSSEAQPQQKSRRGILTRQFAGPKTSDAGCLWGSSGRCQKGRCRASPCCFVKEDMVMPQTYDFGPLFGSTVGFDRVFDLLQSATRGPKEGDKFPPYDIERTGENAYRITLAVAGFSEDDLTITAERN